jgi:hypothetical protein
MLGNDAMECILLPYESKELRLLRTTEQAAS